MKRGLCRPTPLCNGHAYGVDGRTDREVYPGVGSPSSLPELRTGATTSALYSGVNFRRRRQKVVRAAIGVLVELRGVLPARVRPREDALARIVE